MLLDRILHYTMEALMHRTSLVSFQNQLQHSYVEAIEKYLFVGYNLFSLITKEIEIFLLQMLKLFQKQKPNEHRWEGRQPCPT